MCHLRVTCIPPSQIGRVHLILLNRQSSKMDTGWITKTAQPEERLETSSESKFWVLMVCTYDHKPTLFCHTVSVLSRIKVYQCCCCCFLFFQDYFLVHFYESAETRQRVRGDTTQNDILRIHHICNYVPQSMYNIRKFFRCSENILHTTTLQKKEISESVWPWLHSRTPCNTPSIHDTGWRTTKWPLHVVRPQHCGSISYHYLVHLYWEHWQNM